MARPYGAMGFPDVAAVSYHGLENLAESTGEVATRKWVKLEKKGALSIVLSQDGLSEIRK